WFLHKIANVLEAAGRLRGYAGGTCPKSVLLEAKQLGFSDHQVGTLLGADAAAAREMRRAYGLAPVAKQIDTLAAEYPSQTNYLYLTYNGDRADVGPCGPRSVLVLGSGAYRIGSS